LSGFRRLPDSDAIVIIRTFVFLNSQDRTT
jgi:hypothetical protein